MKLSVQKLVRASIAIILAVLLLVAVEVLSALNGPDLHFHNPSRAPVHFGGVGASPLVYVVMGDSTAAGEGAPYADGIAIETARHLAERGPVSMVNLAVSGATIADVRREQLSRAVGLKPDLVLLAVGANDVTHFTPSSKVRSGLSAILEALGSARLGLPVVLTGSPELGSAPRFAQPLRWFASTQTARVNRIIMDVARFRGAVFAPIAEQTGALFAADRALYAPDRFHPSARGYATWFSILNGALDEAGRQVR
jgi:acyl-CoA thioesterase I